MEEIYKKLIRHFSKIATKDEENAVKKFKEYNALEYQTLKDIWTRKGQLEIADFKPQQAWMKLESKLPKPSIRDIFRLKQLPRLVPITAVLLILAIASWYFIGNQIQTPAFYTQINDSALKVMLVQLRDGSKIWLNTDASLSYPKKFSSSSRDVAITGEAYFEIADDKDKPFVITTAHSNIRVLGTSFNVQAGIEETSVIVNTGKISVSTEDGFNQEIIESGQMAIVNNTELITGLNPNMNFMAWQSGEFHFDSADLLTVIEDLNTYYKNQLMIDKASKFDCALTGSFSKAPLMEILETLVLTCGVTIDREDNRFVIKSQ
jgi:ferric-dicitrate binding protein FerR (iron transport regulator)